MHGKAAGGWTQHMMGATPNGGGCRSGRKCGYISLPVVLGESMEVLMGLTVVVAVVVVAVVAVVV